MASGRPASGSAGAATIIALALTAQLSGLGFAFRAFALVLLPAVFFLGVVIHGRLLQVNEGVRDAQALGGKGPGHRQGSHGCPESGPLPSSPRSSLPVEVLTWLTGRLAYLLPPQPPGRGGTPPLALEVGLDAVGAVVLDGLSSRRAGRMVGISKTEVGDSIALLLGELAAPGVCQPDGRFVTSLADLGDRLVEMAATSAAVCIHGLATRVQRPRSWANQKVLYDAKRHTHTAQGVAVSRIHGDLLGCDGGWPGSCHEHELLALSGIAEVLDVTRAVALVDRGFRGLATTRQHWHAPIGDRRTKDRLTDAERATTATRPACAPWWSSRSGSWPAPGRCAAGVACCTGSVPSTEPPPS